MTTFLKNTNIAGLMKVSSGDFAVLEEMTKEFKQLVQKPLKKAAAASAGQNAPQPAESAGKP